MHACFAPTAVVPTWQNMWQGGSAMLGSAAGFQADKMMRRSSGLFFIL